MAEKKSVITLNLGSQRVGMARFGISGKGGILLKDYAFSELPGDPTADGTRRNGLTEAVRQLTAQFKVAEASVNYAVPGQFLIAKFVKLPPLAEDQVEKIVGFEAQQAVPFPLNETVWDYQLMGKTGGEVEVGIVAIRSEHLTELHGAVEGANLDTHLVDAAPVALYNAYRYNYPEQDACVLLIDLGARTTNLLFIEGHRVFISTFQTGGASITQSIAREMGMDYDSAEGRKMQEGFVNLGGNYADHEDPEVDAMSKVIRNALLKVHGEITRRTNAYRSQQGGSAPTAVYLAGAGASLPYLKEVFEEKLRIPVEYFNPLINVAVGPRVNVEQVGAEAHTLGELVGLALREMSCPMELDLSPASVKATKDVGSKKPRLLLAAGCLLAGLATLFAFEKSAASSYARETSRYQNEVDKLIGFDNQIKGQEQKQLVEEKRAEYLHNAIQGRTYWVDLMNKINAQFEDEKIWLTQISPVDSKGEAAVPPLYTNAPTFSFSTGANTVGGPAKPNTTKGKTITVNALYIAGINRSNTGENVPALFSKLRALKDYFEFDPLKTDDDLLREFVYNDVKAASSREGYAFQMLLPLKRKFEITVPDKPVMSGSK
ncbi:MAG: Type pilus assembly protein PilM [Verrucomicrobiales bacterium]|nr:Type pilus assembly protein PilM [Verrucomicrobiales bacterium]